VPSFNVLVLFKNSAILPSPEPSLVAPAPITSGVIANSPALNGSPCSSVAADVAAANKAFCVAAFAKAVPANPAVAGPKAAAI
jgi:hypothetical protein